VVPAKDQKDSWQVLGDPTEGALVVLSRKGGIAERSTPTELIAEIPFDSQRKAMSVVYREGDGSLVMYTKGAPEVILPLCTHELVSGESRPLSDERRQAIFEECARLAASALRVLALSLRKNPVKEMDKFLEKDLV